ncbi:MAG: ABC transporter substrate-binding protein [Thermoplasmata archaeon]|nr:MAG: ABC transporter substrate-binding protein [Thermoplasmata archaeon]
MADFKNKIKHFGMLGMVLAVVLTLVITPGCIIDEDEFDPEAETLTVFDDMGNNVTVEKYPMRIASLSPSATEILYALDVGDRIVGIDSASNYPSEASNHEVVFTYTGLNNEKLVEVNPDLVILNHNLDLSGNARSKIKEFGYSLVILNPVIIEDVLDNIELIGKLTGRDSEAKVLMDTMEDKIDEIEAKGLEHSSQTTTKVLYVVDYDGSDDPWVACENTYVDDIITKAGGMNIISGYEGFIQVSLETIVDENPDIIICSQNDAFPTPTRETILADPVLKELDAVEAGEIYDVNADIVERPGPRITEGLEFFYQHISDL